MSTPIETHERPAHKYPQASTRHHVVNGRFAALLAEDFGIEWATVLEALVGEPQKASIQLCEWASTRSNPAGALKAWAIKNQRGTHRPQPSESPGDTAPRPVADRTPHPDTMASPRRSESLRGVLVDPARLAQTAEKLGV